MEANKGGIYRGRLQLHALAYNLGIFMRTLALPEGGGAMVADHPAGEAGQDRRQGGEPRPLRHLPDGRGGGAAAALWIDPAGLCPSPAAATSFSIREDSVSSVPNLGLPSGGVVSDIVFPLPVASTMTN